MWPSRRGTYPSVVPRSPSSRRAAPALREGKVKPADPFELIRWLAHCQQDPRKAAAELVQNSLDAGATRVDIVRRRDKGQFVLQITDDGSGVIPELPRDEALAWIATHIGHSRKRNLTPEQRRELMTQGQFGIGILGFWCLGEHLVIATAVDGEPPVELHLWAEKANYRVAKSRGRLGLRHGTEVTIRGLHPHVGRALTARKLNDYLALELRGQLLERSVQVVVHDRIARGSAQKVWQVKPLQFPGPRVAVPEQLAVAGHRAARVELHLNAESESPLRVSLAAGGTVVLDDIVELAPELLGGGPFASGRLCGVIDFPDLEPSPGSRRGVATGAARDALLTALADLTRQLDELLAHEQQRRHEEVEQRQLRSLRKAFLAVRRQAPELSFFDVAAGNRGGAGADTSADAGAAPEENAARVGHALAPGTSGPTSPPDEAVADAAGIADGDAEAPAQRALFPPGPLATLQVRPPSTRVEILGQRRLRAVPLDGDGRTVTLTLPISWTVSTGGGRVEALSADGRHAQYVAPDAPGEATITACAVEREVRVEGSANVRVVDEIGSAAGAALGFPPPEFVDEPAGEWRSRVLDGRWQVNRAHPDFQAAAAGERLQLRYLATLLAKELVVRTFPQPQIARPLEQLVRLVTILNATIER